MKPRGIAPVCGIPVVLLLVTACGGGPDQVAASPATTVLSARDATSTLRAHGWAVREVAGMPRTASGVHQVAYLELTTPDGFGIDAQYLDSPADAARELAAAEKQMAGCKGTTIDNAMVFSHGDGRATIPAATLTQLRSLLRST